MGAKGKWIRGDVSWNTLSYLNYRRECNEAHVEWMQEFLASHTAVANRQHCRHRAVAGAEHLCRQEPVEPAGPGPEDRRRPGAQPRARSRCGSSEQPAAVGLNLSRTARRRPRRRRRRGQDADDGGLELAPTITVEGEVVDPASVGTIGRPAHGIFLTSGGGRPARRRPGGPRHHPRPAGKRPQRGTADLRHGRDHPAHPRPGRKPLPDRLLPQAQADRPGYGVGRVGGTAHAGRPHPVPAGQLRRRPPGPAALGMALQVREPRHGAAAVAAPGRSRLPGRPRRGPDPRGASGSPGTWCRRWANPPPAAGARRGWRPRQN